jgi:3-phenylpropionate/trans-cinnamate dioxygenase ferredoxin reductase subunit
MGNAIIRCTCKQEIPVVRIYCMDESIVIVGAGQAASQAIATLRAEKYGGALTLIGDEPYAPYQRPPLSKAFLAGDLHAERLSLRPDSFYRGAQCELMLNCRATRIDRGFQNLILDDGRSIPYSKLLLTTGGRVRQITVPGADLPGIYYLRTIADSEVFGRALVTGRRLAVIGAGYIGLEVAAVAVGRGLDVLLLELAPRVMARTASEPVSAFYLKVHSEAGVRFLLNTPIERFEGTERLEAIWAGGERVEIDVAIVGIGAAPNDSLAVESGLDCKDGVRVDHYFRTHADPAIFAAGDCARHTSIDGIEQRLECVQNAIDQAKFAAYSMLGKPRVYKEVPWFWSDQYDLKLRTAGIASSSDELVLYGDPDSRKFAVFHLRGGRLTALESINLPNEYVIGRKLIAERGTLPARWLTHPLRAGAV